MLKAGSWNKGRGVTNAGRLKNFFSSCRYFPPVPQQNGFTLIEVIVVMSLIAVMLVTAFPRLSGFLTTSDNDRAFRWVIAQNTRLTTQAASSQQRCILRVDVSGNQLSAMTPSDNSDNSDENPVAAVEPMLVAKAGDTFIPTGSLRIIGVAFSDREKIQSGTADIVYYEQGYSDQAIIYMTDGGERFSFYIAPFLSRARVYDGSVSFRQIGKRL